MEVLKHCCCALGCLLQEGLGRCIRPVARFYALALILFLSPSQVMAFKQQVYYAGVAYLGDYKYVDNNYPLTRKINSQGGREGFLLDKALVEKFKGKLPKNFDLKFGLGNVNENKNIALAVAIDKERINREFFQEDGGYTKLIYDISVQVIFFDIEEQSLVKSYPLSFAFNDISKSDLDLSPQEKLEVIRGMYLGVNNGEGLLDLVVEKVSDISLSEKRGLRFQLDSVSLQERVLKRMSKGLEVEQVKQSVGQYFSSQLSEQTGVSVLPYNRGYAIGHQLPGAFANGEVFSLRIPEPDFYFSIDLKNAFSKKVKGNLLYGVQMFFSLEEPVSKTQHLGGDFRYAVFKLIADRQDVEDDWSAYEDAIENLIRELVGQLKYPVYKWHKEHAKDALVYNRFKKKRGIFNVY